MVPRHHDPHVCRARPTVGRSQRCYRSSIGLPALDPRARCEHGVLYRMAIDDPENGVGVHVFGDHVGQPLEPGLSDVGEIRQSGRHGEAPTGSLGRLRQERPTEAVVLEQPVPRRPRHRAHPAALVGEERRPTGSRHDAVMDLVPLDASTPSARFREGRAKTFSAPNVVCTGSRPRPSTVPRRLSTGSSIETPNIW